MMLGIILVPFRENYGGMLLKKNWQRWKVTKSTENAIKVIYLLEENRLSASGSLT